MSNGANGSNGGTSTSSSASTNSSRSHGTSGGPEDPNVLIVTPGGDELFDSDQMFAMWEAELGRRSPDPESNTSPSRP